MRKKERILFIVFLLALLWLSSGCMNRQKSRIEASANPAEQHSQQDEEEETKKVIEVTRRPEESTRKSGESQEEENTDQDLSSQGSSETVGEQPVSLLFGGDVLLSDHVLNAYSKSGSIGGVLDEGYRKLIADSSFFMVNQEFPFSSRGVQAEDKQFTFRLPPEKVSVFREMGIDGVTLANNHALDYGTDALEDSIVTLDEAGILHTGAGKNLQEASQPISIEFQGISVALIGATRVIPVAGWAAEASHPGMLATYDPSVLLSKIQELKETHDYVIVFVHWGIERDSLPQDYQRALGKQYIDAGADAVIGSHPHVLQGIEYYKDCPIVYSLGNFVFGSSIPRTALLQLNLYDKEQKPILRLFPGTSGAGFTRMITDETEKEGFWAYMNSISFGVSIQPDGTVIQDE